MTEMSIATFDTLAAVRNLEKAGMGTSQAEAVTETIRVAVFQGVASKEDLGEIRNELKGDIAELRVDFEKLRGEMKEDIAKLGTTLTWRMLGGFSVLLSVFLGLSLYIVRTTGGGL